MTNNSVDPPAARAAEVETEAKKIGGEETWGGVMHTLERKMATGELSPAELQRALVKPTAAGDLLYQGLGDADEQTWRKWRDSQPRKAARIAGTKR